MVTKANARRAHIVGGPGSGKSTLAANSASVCLAISIEWFVPLAEFNARLDTLIR